MLISGSNKESYTINLHKEFNNTKMVFYVVMFRSAAYMCRCLFEIFFFFFSSVYITMTLLSFSLLVIIIYWFISTLLLSLVRIV